MKMHHDQRQYSRSKVTIGATLTPEHGDAFGVKVGDISMGGMFVHCDKKLTPGSRCSVSILLGHFMHELPITADAVVVRTLKNGMALKFDSIQTESIPSMQNLIVDNSDNPDQAILEFSSHGGWIFTPQ